MKALLKDVLKSVLVLYVRNDQEVEFLEKLYVLTNEYCGSTVWTAVAEVLEEYKN